MPYFRLGDMARVTERSRLPELVGVVGKVVRVGAGDSDGRVIITICTPQITRGTDITSHEDSAQAFELATPPMTTTARLLRSLQEHRDQMRDMMEILRRNDAEEAFEERLMRRTGDSPRWLGRCNPGECECCNPNIALERMWWDCINATRMADCPEMAELRVKNASLRRELSDCRDFIAAVHSMAQWLVD